LASQQAVDLNKTGIKSSAGASVESDSGRRGQPWLGLLLVIGNFLRYASGSVAIAAAI